MIVAESRYFNYAHRIADYELDSSVTTLYDGQWLALNTTGKFAISTGAAGAKSYITISSKWGDVTTQINQPITAGVLGRDTVSSTGRVAVLIGPYRLETDQYDTSGTYTIGMPLKVYDVAATDPSYAASKAGKLVPSAFLANPTTAAHAIADNLEARKVVAYVIKVPVDANDTIGIAHE